jgi:hypothetical protein
MGSQQQGADRAASVLTGTTAYLHFSASNRDLTFRRF